MRHCQVAVGLSSDSVRFRREQMDEYWLQSFITRHDGRYVTCIIANSAEQVRLSFLGVDSQGHMGKGLERGFKSLKAQKWLSVETESLLHISEISSFLDSHLRLSFLLCKAQSFLVDLLEDSGRSVHGESSDGGSEQASAIKKGHGHSPASTTEMTGLRVLDLTVSALLNSETVIF